MVMTICSQRYVQNEEAFSALTKSDILQPSVSDHDFRSIDISDAGEHDGRVGCNLLISDIRYQTSFTVAQPIKIQFKFDDLVPNKTNAYAFLSSNKLVSVTSDGQKRFD